MLALIVVRASARGLRRTLCVPHFQPHRSRLHQRNTMLSAFPISHKSIPLDKHSAFCIFNLSDSIDNHNAVCISNLMKVDSLRQKQYFPHLHPHRRRFHSTSTMLFAFPASHHSIPFSTSCILSHFQQSKIKGLGAFRPLGSRKISGGTTRTSS